MTGGRSESYARISRTLIVAMRTLVEEGPEAFLRLAPPDLALYRERPELALQGLSREMRYYPATFLKAGAEALAAIDAFEVEEDGMRAWDVAFPFTSAEEGRSDLELRLDVFDRPNALDPGLLDMRFRDVLVP
jgi:hypothetical protein